MLRAPNGKRRTVITKSASVMAPDGYLLGDHMLQIF